MNPDRVRQPRPLASEPRRVIDSPYLNAAEAATYLRYRNARVLYKAIAHGVENADGERIPFVRRGHTLLFHRDHIDRWLAGDSRVRLMREARANLGASVGDVRTGRWGQK